MTTLYAVTWIAWTCVGDGRLWGLSWRTVPDQVRPAAAAIGLCRPTAVLEADAGNLVAARALVAQHGPGSQLYACGPTACRALPIVWNTTPSFPEGNP